MAVIVTMDWVPHIVAVYIAIIIAFLLIAAATLATGIWLVIRYTKRLEKVTDSITHFADAAAWRLYNHRPAAQPSKPTGAQKYGPK